MQISLGMRLKLKTWEWQYGSGDVLRDSNAFLKSRLSIAHSVSIHSICTVAHTRYTCAISTRMRSASVYWDLLDAIAHKKDASIWKPLPEAEKRPLLVWLLLDDSIFSITCVILTSRFWVTSHSGFRGELLIKVLGSFDEWDSVEVVGGWVLW